MNPQKRAIFRRDFPLRLAPLIGGARERTKIEHFDGAVMQPDKPAFLKRPQGAIDEFPFEPR